MADYDDVIVLEQGEEQAQKVAKAISSQTANDILTVIGDQEMTSTDIAGALHVPMSTIKYHIENLLDVGLLEIVRTKYSVKGREIKIYRQKPQLLIVAPKSANVRLILAKYASLFGITAFVSAILYALVPVFSQTSPTPVMELSDKVCTPALVDTFIEQVMYSPPLPDAFPSRLAEGASRVSGEYADKITPVAVDEVFHTSYQGNILTDQFLTHDTAIAFFLGGCFILMVVCIWEFWQFRRQESL